MRALLFVAFVLLCRGARARVLSRCELAKELSVRLRVPIQATATWVCIAYRESRLNTAAQGFLNADGSSDHGIFQISELYWCGKHGPGKECRLSCSDLRDDDLSDDVACAMKIYREHQGISGDGYTAWAVYKPYCMGNVKKYIADCDVRGRPVYDSNFDFSDQYNVTERVIPPYRMQFSTVFDIDKLLPITTTNKYIPVTEKVQTSTTSTHRTTKKVIQQSIEPVSFTNRPFERTTSKPTFPTVSHRFSFPSSTTTRPTITTTAATKRTTSTPVSTTSTMPTRTTVKYATSKPTSRTLSTYFPTKRFTYSFRGQSSATKMPTVQQNSYKNSTKFDYAYSTTTATTPNFNNVNFRPKPVFSFGVSVNTKSESATASPTELKIKEILRAGSEAQAKKPYTAFDPHGIFRYY